ncbi:MAG: hypothetical protein ACLSVD_10155 [Eggerthellaceae bacterium]
MDFKLTDEQELIVDSYREYMESENWETTSTSATRSTSTRCAG